MYRYRELDVSAVTLKRKGIDKIHKRSREGLASVHFCLLYSFFFALEFELFRDQSFLKNHPFLSISSFSENGKCLYFFIRELKTNEYQN